MKSPSDSCLTPYRSPSGLLLLAIVVSGCGTLQWDYKIPNGGDEGDPAQYQPTGPIPGLVAGEAVAFLRYKATEDFFGPFPTSVVEIAVHDPRPGGSGTTIQAREAGFRVSGNRKPDPTVGYGRGGTFEGSGRGTWTQGDGRGAWSEGGGRGESVTPQPLVVQTHINSPRVYRKGEEFDLLFDCKNTSQRAITEIVLVDHLDARLLVSNPRGATVTKQGTGTQVRWQQSLDLAPGKTTRFRLTCRVKPKNHDKKVLN